MPILFRRPAAAAAMAVVPAFLWVSACAPAQFVSYYDEPTDAALTAPQAALNAALKVVRDFVNGKAGFTLV